MNRIPFSPKSAQRGVALIEAMVAILLFSIGVLAVAGLQASMIKNTGDSKFRADASYIAQQAIAQLWANPDKPAPAYLNTATDIHTQLPNGTVTVKRLTADPTIGTVSGQYEVEVNWQPPGDPVVHSYKVVASIFPG